MPRIIKRYSELTGRITRFQLAESLAGALDRRVQRDSALELRMIAKTFGLTGTELGGLFRVSRQAVEGWEKTGVPVARADEISSIAEIASVLRRRFKPASIPRIAHGALPGLGGRTILETLATECGPRDVFAMLERLRFYVPVA